LGSGLNQATDIFDELPAGRAAGKPRELRLEKLFGDIGRRLGRVVRDHRHDERAVFRHVVRAIDRLFPLAAEIALSARLRVRRDDRDEQRALADLPADLRVPRVAAAEFTQVEPHLDTECAQRIRDPARRVVVFAGVTQKDRFAGIRHGGGIETQRHKGHGEQKRTRSSDSNPEAASFETL
jgi:hypothetical protein